MFVLGALLLALFGCTPSISFVYIPTECKTIIQT